MGRHTITRFVEIYLAFRLITTIGLYYAGSVSPSPEDDYCIDWQSHLQLITPRVVSLLIYCAIINPLITGSMVSYFERTARRVSARSIVTYTLLL